MWFKAMSIYDMSCVVEHHHDWPCRKIPLLDPVFSDQPMAVPDSLVVRTSRHHSANVLHCHSHFDVLQRRSVAMKIEPEGECSGEEQKSQAK